MDVIRARNHLVIVVNTVNDYVLAHYSTLLGSCGIRAVTEKRSLVSSLFGSAHRNIDRMDTIVQLAEMVIKDCDQAAWALKSTVTALEIATARERTV